MLNDGSWIEACLTWDQSLYGGRGGFHFRIHTGIFKGVYLTCRSDYGYDRLGRWCHEITYDIKEDPSQLAIFNLDMIEARVMHILNRGHRVEANQPYRHQGASNT